MDSEKKRLIERLLFGTTLNSNSVGMLSRMNSEKSIVINAARVFINSKLEGDLKSCCAKYALSFPNINYEINRRALQAVDNARLN